MTTHFSAFVEMVHDALNRLYDSHHLQQHPLGTLLLDVSCEPVWRSQQLRKVLLDAIAAMRPQPGVPAQSPDWRAYRILELRYIEGQGVREVMEQIALAKSQYYREQARVVESLATNLWAQRRMEETTVDEVATSVTRPPGVARQEVAQVETQLLLDQAVWEVVDLAEVLEGLKAYIIPLATAKQVEVTIDADTACTIERADRALVRQAILTTITYGLNHVFGLVQGQPRLVVRLFRNTQVLGIAVTLQSDSTSIVQVTHPLSERSNTPVRSGVGLNICRRLMENMRGHLNVQSLRVPPDEEEHRLEVMPESTTNPVWEAYLTWPIPRDSSLLVIDDNASFADLFRRYLHQHRWRVIGATSGVEARQILQEMCPTVILLDVMLPKEDGWEILRDLRSQAALAQMPIIICSVLNEPELASTLGASAFLLKPVTQQALLAALAPWHQDAASPA